MDGFGERLRTIRLAKGMSAAKFAEMTGMSYDAIMKMESGKRGNTMGKLPKMAKALGCRIDDLFPEMDESAEDRDDLSDFEG